MPDKCKKCGDKDIRVRFEKSDMYVVVDKQTKEPLVMNKGDQLCDVCNLGVDYYRKVVY